MGVLKHRDMQSSSLSKSSAQAAFQQVRESLNDLDEIAEAKDTDLIFLRGLMDSPVVCTLVKTQDKLESPIEAPKPVLPNSSRLIHDLTRRCDPSQEALELRRIISKPHFQALIETHDEVANLKDLPRSNSSASESPSEDAMIEESIPLDAVRMVGLRKSANEPLGLTIQTDANGNLVIARILAGGMIDRQGLLHAGDIIREVNGVGVRSPEELQAEIARARESVTLKVVPSVDPEVSAKGQVKKAPSASLTLHDGTTTLCYMRALFDYDPKEDTLLPCSDIGLEFQHGDILQILNQNDPNWWQAKKVGSSGHAGLIPSQELEERRKAFVDPDKDYCHTIGICGTRISKKKKTLMYQSKQNADFDKAELSMYEEVTRMPPFRRKTLALVGCHGVGRRTLKNRLINSDPEKFAAVIPYTSRPQRDELEENGKSYWFQDRASFEKEVREHQFLEYGEHNGHLYGTKLESIRSVIRSGKMCVLDCSPAALKILHNSQEFMPYVVFIASPGMEELRNIHEYGANPYASRNLAFERASSIRYSSRRARTLESLASLYEEEDLKRTLEESSFLQRNYEKYIDQVIINEDFDVTFRKVAELLDNMTTEHQWVPVSWVY
ncbi:protein PALS2 isoform X2 [Neocloeon triangulifer]|uniref:protein PALS2 isoform X2 n=1 Tax=Neocloeon triangulifer TaxID=2078957 RepID=UPI00286F7801|nr:protein PALS2 isoform X2 [Neocloeon triangulifer]